MRKPVHPICACFCACDWSPDWKCWEVHAPDEAKWERQLCRNGLACDLTVVQLVQPEVTLCCRVECLIYQCLERKHLGTVCRRVSINRFEVVTISSPCRYHLPQTNLRHPPVHLSRVLRVRSHSDQRVCVCVCAMQGRTALGSVRRGGWRWRVGGLGGGGSDALMTGNVTAAPAHGACTKDWMGANNRLKVARLSHLLLDRR